MTHDEAYYEAEKKIEEALKSGATKLVLGSNYNTPDKEKLSELPESLWNLQQLKSLSISHTTLTTLPESLGQLTQLTMLNLSWNRLTTLPESLGQLTQLTELYLTSNKLKSFPRTILQLEHLKRLHLGSYIPPEARGSVYLSPGEGNHIKSIPESISRLTKLEVLDFSANYLRELPKSISGLTNLVELDFSANYLRELPKSISRLINLVELDFSFNDLTELPIWLTQLSSLRTIDLELNPLNPELAEAYKQGIEGVKAYLRAKAESQITLNEAKLIIIGEGEVGKSCLLDALLDKPFQPHESTHGIEIQSFNVTTDTQTAITLNAWDFGGQRVYRPTHQLFFSAPAVYLVVWKPREGSQAGQVKEWIQLILRRAPSSKLLLSPRMVDRGNASPILTVRNFGISSARIPWLTSSSWIASQIKKASVKT